jgi:hypothetical protein
LSCAAIGTAESLRQLVNLSSGLNSQNESQEEVGNVSVHRDSGAESTRPDDDPLMRELFTHPELGGGRRRWSAWGACRRAHPRVRQKHALPRRAI